LITVAAVAVFMARQWSFKAAFFPLVTGIPLLVLATAQLLAELFGQSPAANETRFDLELADDVPPEMVRRRTVTIFAWIAGFILLVFLLGFSLAIPLFVLAYLALQPGVKWWLKISLTALAWGGFYGLFVHLLHLPFETGRIQVWLGWD
jgi:hypothetical protein